jgi:restriction system protein
VARRRYSSSRTVRRRPSGQSGASCLVVVAGLGILAFIVLDAVAAEVQLLSTNPLVAIVALVLAIAIAASGVWVWLRWRHARVVEANRRYEAYLAYISTLNGLLSLSPSQFELAIRDLLRFWGYPDVQHTGRGGDLAADIVCRDTTGSVTVVQCKRYAPTNLVNSPEIQMFIGMIYAHHHAQQGIFVTTSGFTQPALALAREHNIRTIDGNELVSYIQQWRSAIQEPQQTS